MIVADCPSKVLLSEYSLGKLSEPEMQQLDRHLDDCDSCCRAVDIAGHDDSLLGLLGTEEGAIPSDVGLAGDAYEQAAADLKRLLRGDVDALPLGGNLGPYTLIEPVGSGGMGQVYRAIHRRLNKTVAIKLLPQQRNLDSLAVARFEREVTAVGALQHAAIIQATDAGEVEGMPYLVMQFIDGLDLSALMRVTGALPTAEACEVVRQAAIAIAYANDHGIVHRDIKPSNLMLERNGQVKVLDLGLARMSGSFQHTASLLGSLTGTGQLLGTLDYMSPEQANDGAVDARTDVYALGATLYKLLTGRAVGDLADQSTSALSRLQRRTTIDGIEFRDVPTAVVALLRRLLHPDPEQRLSSALETANMLAEHCEGADLQTLVEHAQQIAIERQSLLRSAPTHAGCGSATTHPTSSGQGNSDHLASITGNGRGRLWSIVAIAAAGWIALLTVIVLQTRRGQIVIESDIPGIEVSVLRDGKVYEQLTIQTDAKSMKLFADRYEIRLPSADGKLQVTPSEVQLRQGQTVVVRVIAQGLARTNPREIDPLIGKPLKTEMDQRSAAVAAVVDRGQDARRVEDMYQPLALEPLYQGKTLSSWLQIVRYERDPNLVRVALNDALPHLSGRDTNDRIQGALFERMSQQSYRDRSYFDLDNLATGPIEGRIAQWLSDVETILASDSLAATLASGDPNLQAAGLRIIVTALLSNPNAEISELTSDRIDQLCSQETSEIAFAAYLAKLLQGDKFSPQQLKIAQRIASHDDPYVACLGAKVLAECGPRPKKIESFERLQSVIAEHADFRLVSEAALLLDGSQSDPEITRLTAEAVLALQNRRPQESGVWRLQNRLLRAIQRLGRKSEPTLSTLQTVLKNRYRSGSSVRQSSTAAGFESMAGFPVIGAMGGPMNGMMEGYDGGFGGGYGDMMMDDEYMEEPALNRKISFGNSYLYLEDAQPRFSDLTPRPVIDAIFALTGDIEAWDEPIGELRYAKDVNQWLNTQQRQLPAPRRPDIEAYAEYFFPRSLYPKLIRQGLGEYAKSLPKGIDALGVTESGEWSKSRRGEAAGGGMGLSGMDMGGMGLGGMMGGMEEMGMGGYGGMEDMMEDMMSSRMSGRYAGGAYEKSIPGQFRVENLIAANLSFARPSPLYNRLILQMLTDSTLHGQLIRVALLRHWEQSLDPQGRTAAEFLHLPAQYETRWHAEMTNGESELDRGIALRIAIRISDSAQGAKLARLIDRQMGAEDDDWPRNLIGADATAFLADATAHLLDNAKREDNPSDVDRKLLENLLQSLLGQLVRSDDARNRLFALWISMRAKVPLQAQQYRAILNTEIPQQIVGKKSGNNSSVALNLRQTITANSQWLSDQCNIAYLQANPDSGQQDLNGLRSNAKDGIRRLIDYSTFASERAPSQLELSP